MKPIDRIRVSLVMLIIVTFTSILACDLLSVVGGGPTPFPIETGSTVGTGAIAGFLWHDSCASPAENQEKPPSPPPGCLFQPSTNGLQANGLPDTDERGIEGVQVTLGEGVCPSYGLTTSTTDGDGLYLFTGLRAGTYCVMVDPKQGANPSLLPPGLWTYPAVTLPDETTMATVVLEDDEIKSDVFFGWDYELLPLFEPAATEISTETATTTPIPLLTETPTPSFTPTLTPAPSFTPTVTVSTTDPKSGLGDPTWRDTLENSVNWPLYEDDHVRFEVEDGVLTMIALNADYWNGWMQTWPVISNFYLEATVSIGECSGLDAYGVMARVTRTDQGQKGYLVGFSCDGRYSLRTWDGESYTMLTEWTSSLHIIPGAQQTNRVGFWADGNLLKLYANGNLLAELRDGTFDKGMFGVFVGAVKTENLTVMVDEIVYWDLP